MSKSGSSAILATDGDPCAASRLSPSVPPGPSVSSVTRCFKTAFVGRILLGSNGGHKGTPGFDPTFGTDEEALIKYGKLSVKKTHDAAVAIIKRAYGRAPERFYFGGSQGGHEALDAAARYLQDYDGVVARH